MPVYNAQDYVESAIRSLLRQTYKKFELLVVDDASTDNSLKIIEGIDDSRIRILKNKENRGIVYSRNRGLEAMRGDYFAPFDADDIARHDKLEKQLSFLEAHPDYGMVGAWARLIDENGRTLKQRWKLNAPPERIPAILLFRNYFVQSAALVRREALPEEGYEAGKDAVEDYLLWMRIAKDHLVWNYPEYLVYYRVHSSSITQNEASLMPRRDALVFQALYAPLKVSLTRRKLQLLQILKNGQNLIQMDDLKDMESFLLEILQHNERYQKYDQKALEKVVANRWLKACLRAKGLKHQMVGRLFRSPLTRLLGCFFLVNSFF